MAKTDRSLFFSHKQKFGDGHLCDSLGLSLMDTRNLLQFQALYHHSSVSEKEEG
jgi:hypothetical protein